VVKTVADHSGIEWTDATWSPTLGCTKVSSGCDNCYAIRTVHRMAHNPNPKLEEAAEGLTAYRPGHGLQWTGAVRTLPDRLDLPLRWRKPRMIFVDSQSDLFHEKVPDEFIARVFAVMAATPRHIYQILTKRHGRMRAFLQDRCRCGSGHGDGVHLRSAIEWASTPHNPDYVPGLESGIYHRMKWPLPNVWLGVSVEDQQRADLRIPALLDTPAAVRWLSCEPLLGPVDLLRLVFGLNGIDWVVAGGESGPRARPMHPAWARSLRDQCTVAGVPFHFKQFGNWRLGVDVDPDLREHGREELFDGDYFVSVGKKAAGRELDGRTWDEFPKVTKAEGDHP
jgi:protein gp37